MNHRKISRTQTSLDRLWSALADPTQALSSLSLDNLSNLDLAHLARFQETWSMMSGPRCRELLGELITLAEDRVDVNFNDIFRQLLSDGDPWVRELALEGLWEDEDIRLITPLITLLQKDPAPLVRAAAALSLGRFQLLGELEEIDRVQAQRVQQALLSAYSGEEHETLVRRRLLEALAYSSEPAVPDFILEAYEDDDEGMRLSALFAMGRSADLRWQDTVLAELNSSDPAMCFEAARASGELELAEAVPTLISFLDEDDIELRDAAIWALGRIGGPAARRALQACYESDDQNLRSAAEEALAELEFLSGDDDLPAFIFDF